MVTATCPDCGWTMPADDADEADLLLEVHRIVKLNDAMGAET